jgi:tetraacyldisaccharide 4'-kinase
MVGNGIDAIVMDDGLQNPGLAQDMRLIVVDGASGFGNERGIPAGPLREDIGAGLARVDAMIVVGKDEHHLIERFSSQSNILQAFIEIESAGWLSTQKLVAFAGIGRPEKFKASLKEAGADIAEFHGFADHHPYTDAEIGNLLGRAERLGALLVTTEKDWVRLTDHWRRYIKAVAINIVWKDEHAIELLINSLSRRG